MSVRAGWTRLRRGEVLSARIDREGACVRVARGAVWATIEGDAADHVVASGESARLPGPGRVVVEPLADVAVVALHGCAGEPEIEPMPPVGVRRVASRPGRGFAASPPRGTMGLRRTP